MGALIMYEEVLPVWIDNKSGQNGTIEVRDNHGTPEVVIGPVDNAYQGWTAEFKDWKKFEEFVDAVNELHFRLRGTKS